MRIPVSVLLFVTGAAAAEPAPILIAPTVPPVFRLLAEPAVQKDVALTAEQKVAADSIRQQLVAPIKSIYLGPFGTLPVDTIRAVRIAATDAFLAKTLTKEQRARLDQILFQLREKEFGAHMAFAMAARDLGLRPDQLDDVKSLKGLRVEEIAKTVTSGQRFEKIKVAVDATNGETYEKMTEMLTRQQRERMKGLKGKGFDAKVDLSLIRSEPKLTSYPAPQFGLYDIELRFVDVRMQEELKLANSQYRELSRVWGQVYSMTQAGRVLSDRTEEVHSMTEKALAENLNQDQRRRFDQVMMQRRARVSPEAVCSYPAAIGILKLSPIQVQQLAAGKKLKEVLSADQIEKHGRLLGEPYDLPMVNDAYAPILDTGYKPAVAFAQARDFLLLSERLKLSAEQIRKFRDLAEDEPKVRELIYKELSLDDTPPVSGSGRALTALNAVAEQYREAVDQQCWDVLDAPQKSLAKQIFGRRK